MNNNSVTLAWPVLLLTSCGAYAADSMGHSSLTLHGYTGALNVPSAYTAAPGMANLQYSDTFIAGDRYDHNNNAIGNFGLLPWLEAGGRISWDTTHTNCYFEECGVRDLSANLKLRAPFIPDDWFSLAIGAQDLGGQSSPFSAEYAVISKQMRYGRIDLGAGRADVPERYLDGAFGAVEIQPWQWLGLIGEYDAQNVNAGFRVGLPSAWQPWGIQPELKVMAYSDREGAEDQRFFALSVNIPMGSSKEHYASSAHRSGNSNADSIKILPMSEAPSPATLPRASATAITPITPATPVAPINTQAQPYYEALAAQLVSDKFERILVGEHNGVLYVSFENNQFNRNELDALGLVLKRLSAHAKGHYASAHAILRNQGVATLDVTIKPDNYADFLRADKGASPLFLDVRYPESGQLGTINWFVERSYGSSLKPKFSFSPSLVTAVATEYGVWDYSLAMQTDLSVSLWQGAMINATYNMPVDQSDDFDRYVEDYDFQGVFYPDRQRSAFDEYEIQQTLKISSSLYTTLHAGHFMRDYDGFYNQTAWFSPEGTHKLTLRAGQFDHVDDPLIERNFNLVSYRYFFAGQDVSLETTYGEFWEGDQGYRVDTKFWFGDTAVTLEYKDTDAQFVGMRWTLPLTPRRDWLSPYGQVKGRENWNYGLQTRVNEDLNYVSFGVATVPRSRQEIERTYMNGDRLSPGYVRAHWRRLREAAGAFGG